MKVNVVMPVYNGLEYITIPLNSLTKQTYEDFIVTIVQDYDELDYSNIIKKYREKGLNIDHVKTSSRIKQGPARQLGIDSHPECDYVVFIDQDDKFLPNAIQTLVGKIEKNKSDIIISKFIKETQTGSEIVGQGHEEIITQLHGKIYSLKYLKEKDIKFADNLKYAEDSCFNFKAVYCCEQTTYTDIVTYRWIYNENSESHRDRTQYYNEMIPDFIRGQAESIIHVYKYNPLISRKVIIDTILMLYKLAMVHREKNLPTLGYETSLKELGKLEQIKNLFEDEDVVRYMASNVSGGGLYGYEPIFFNCSFIDWVDEWLEK